MKLTLMDCTLRDGANVVGKGFSAALTDLVLDGLTACHVPAIEFGNAGGIGAYETAGFTQAETDAVYLDLAKQYLDRGSRLGMFLNAKRYHAKNVVLAQEAGLHFLRVGADAGDADISVGAIREIKDHGLEAWYSLMKAYLLTPEGLAEEGKKLQDAGADQLTIMDSAGTMLPDQTAWYTEALKKAVSIPVAFHGHNNLGLSAANAVAAYQGGADMLDCCLMGMARSAGNLATELCVAAMQRYGELTDVDLPIMLDFIDQRLMPAMEPYHYHNPVPPLDLVLGLSGCHSSFLKKFQMAAEAYQVRLYPLIIAVSAVDQKSPSDELIARTAQKLKGG